MRNYIVNIFLKTNQSLKIKRVKLANFLQKKLLNIFKIESVKKKLAKNVKSNKKNKNLKPNRRLKNDAKRFKLSDDNLFND